MLRTLFAFVFGILTGIAVIYVLDGPLDMGLIQHRAGEALDVAGRGAQELRLESSVRAALALQKDFSLVGDVTVDAEGETVTLEGTVETESRRQLAELIARGVEGVDEVVNRLEVELQDTRNPEPGES